ncbi:MAG: T9SS type A sorting domain-containing protein [Bacteroidales bacterium]|nr:T9SS type A sorting domain-containing protein [Bacteroidales bacterium]
MKKFHSALFFLMLMFLSLAPRVTASEGPASNKDNLLYSFMDNAEWHDDFAIDKIEGWIMLDEDGLVPAGPFHDYPNKNQPQAFIMYNPSKTNPPNTFPEYQPRSGDKVFMGITSNDGPSNNWMITSELAPHNGGQFVFYAKGTFDFYGDEEFKVGYSTTGTDPSDFTFFNNGNPYTAAFVWTRHEFDIPAGAKHLAIVHVSYAYCLMVDDVEFTATSAPQSPGMITGFDAEVELGEQMAVHLNWTNPVVDATEGALTELNGVRIFRGTHPMSFSEIAVIEDMEPGEEVSFTDDNIVGTGFFAYRMIPFNTNGDGLQYTSEFLFLDYETVPGAPHTITVTPDENNQSVISWNEVNYGANGGILQDPVTGYTLTRKAGNQTDTLVAMHPDTSFLEAEVPDFNLYTYSVVAHVTPEESGEPGMVNAYSGMTEYQEPVTYGKYESEQVFELTRASIISQSIYYADEIGSAGLITNLAYFSNLGSDGGSNTYKIYMSTTDREVFGTSLSDAVWQYFGTQKLVYEGPITFQAGPRAIEIELDQPFFYDAESGQNVIITVVKPLTENLPTVTNRVFYNTQVEGMRTYYAIGYGVDMSTVTTQPASWATSEIGTIPSIVTTKIHDFASVAGLVTIADGSTGLEGVSVTLVPAENDPAAYQQETTLTLADGTFSFDALLPGNYEVTFFKEGFNTEVAEISLDPEQELVLNVSLSDASIISISGTVTNQAGTPIANAYVNLSGYSLFNAETDENGAFSLQAYGEKDYQLEVIHPLFNSYVDNFTSGSADYSIGTIKLGVTPHKPMNVVAALDEGVAQVNWDVPYGLDHESMLAWGTQTNVNDGYGFGGDEFIAGIRFSHLDLQEALPENGKLTHVKVHFHNYADFIIKVFQGENASTLLYEQEGSVDASGWYTFELNQSILIDQTQEFWIGIHFLPGYGAYPIGIDEGPNAPLKKGSMLYSDGTWTGMSLTNKNWNIYGIVHTTVEADPLGYKVFRGLADAEPSSWTDLTPTAVAENTFLDNTIQDEEPAIYRYGVMAQYGPEQFSEMSLSNPLPLEMIFNIALELQPNSLLPAQAYIRLWNDDYLYETHVEDFENPSAFNGVWRGNYNLEVQMDNYKLLEMENVAIMESQTLEVPVYENKVMPSGLKAELNEDGSSATLSWALHGVFTDNIESYPDFEKTNIGDYILIDGDGLETYTYTNFTWPGAGNPMSWMVFNPFATSPAVNLEPFSGSRYLVALAGPSGPNNDWLIIPAGPGTFSFMASSLVSDSPETFNVLYSTSGSQPADFNALPEGSGIIPPVMWTQYSFEAPEGTKYLAIQYVSFDTYFLLIDDLEYQKPFDHVQSFNIYLDGAMVAQEITDMTHQLAGLEAGTHLVEVEAVYHSGASERASVEILSSVDVDEPLTQDRLHVYPNPSNGTFNLVLPEPAQVRIIDLNGQLIYGDNLPDGHNNISLNLKPGTYILQVQTTKKMETEKLIIK